MSNQEKHDASCCFLHENFLWKGINTKSEMEQRSFKHWCELKQIAIFSDRLDNCNPVACNYFDIRADIDEDHNSKKHPRFTNKEINDIKKYEQERHDQEIINKFKKCEPKNFPDDEDTMNKLSWVAENYIDFLVSIIACDERIKNMFMIENYRGPSCLIIDKIECKSISEVELNLSKKSSGGSQKSVVFKIIVELTQMCYPMWGSTKEITITCNARNLDIVHQKSSIDTSVSIKYIDGWLAN